MKLTPRNIRKIIMIIACGIIIFVICTNLGTAFSLLKRLLSILTPVIIGCCMAFILNVIMRLFDDILFKPLGKVRFLRIIKRPLSILLALILVSGIIGLAVLVIGPQLEQAFSDLVTHLPGYATSVLQWINELLTKLEVPSEQINEICSDWSQLTRVLQNYLSSYSDSLLNSAVNITVSVVGTVFDLILALFIAIYILMKKERICQLADKSAQAFLPRKHYLHAVRIMKLCNGAFSDFIAGQCIEAVILGTLCFLGMLIFGFPYAGVISELIAITSLIPIFGAWIGGGVSALLILMVDPVKALLFVVYILILQQLEGNLIYPKVVGKKVGLPGLLVLIAVVIGSKVGGVAGILVSVPISAILYALFKEAVDTRLEKKKKNTPPETSEEV